MYLLDTNVVSELRKARTGKADRQVVAWAGGIPASLLFLSAISILELELGILLIERRNPPQATALREWLDDRVLPAFSGRVLPVDIPIARRCAQLHVPDRQAERDAFIAATALVHNMTVVTRNVCDFQAAGLRIINPWKPLRARG